MAMVRYLASLILLLPLASYAADGDPCAAADNQAPRECILLCDAHVAANPNTCTAHANAFWRFGSIFYENDAGCSGDKTVTIEHAARSSALAADRALLGTLSAKGDLIVLTEPTLPHIFATITDDAGCTDLTVMLHGR